MTSITLLSADQIARAFPPDEEAGLGSLRTPQGNLPLKLLDVSARVTGLVAETRLRQTFVNTLKVPIEATYVFPLPGRAAVSEFRFEVGDRVVDGVLKERGEARRVYQEALTTGHRAAITEEERPGVFTMRVGNLMPGDEVSVHLTLSGPLALVDGEATYRFPLVVAPRYIPGSALPGPGVGEGTALDTDAVPDASRISPPVLLPGFPNPVQLGIEVELDGSLPLRSLRSSLHAVLLEQEGERKRVRIQPGERLNRDFVLRFGLASDGIQTEGTLHREEGSEEGTFQLVIVPPAQKSQRPRDVAFVLDRSGSMGGWKMVAARRACARLLDGLSDQDRFAVLAFDTRVDRPEGLAQRGMVPATDRNRFRAVEFLSKVDSRGGTEMAEPIDAALTDLLTEDAAEDAPGRDRVLILITDGQVGNEDQLLRTHARRLAQVRCFTLGIDRAVNEAFLERLAEIGRGGCEVVESEDRLDEVMDGIQRRIGTPVLTGLKVEGTGGLEVIPGSVTPERTPDLFEGVPVRIQGRCRGRGAIRMVASAADGSFWSSGAELREVENPALTRTWARARVRTLEDRYVVEGGDLSEQIVALSLQHRVLCRFTSFVAVDRSEVVNQGGEVHKVIQAVEQPEGWDLSLAQMQAPEPFLRTLSASKAPPRLAPSARRSPAPPPPSAADFGDMLLNASAASYNAPDPFGGGGDPFGGGGDPFGGGGDPFSDGGGGGDPFGAKGGSGFGGGDAFAAPAAAAPFDPFREEEATLDAFEVEDAFAEGGAAGAHMDLLLSDEAPRRRAGKKEKAQAPSPSLREELTALLAELDGGAPDWQRILFRVRELYARARREGAASELVRELESLRQVLTQGLLAGGPPADPVGLRKATREGLRACLQALPVPRGESFWF